MVGKKKVLAAIFVSLVAVLLVIGVFAYGPVSGVFNDNDSVVQSPSGGLQAPGIARFSTLGYQWAETSATSQVTTTSLSYVTVPNMVYTMYLPHNGHVEVRFSLEYALSSVDDVQVRCIAVMGTTTRVGIPGYYWLGRGTSTTVYYKSTMVTFVFENLPAGTHTFSIQWHSMTSGHYTYGRGRVMTVTWFMYP